MTPYDPEVNPKAVALIPLPSETYSASRGRPRRRQHQDLRAVRVVVDDRQGAHHAAGRASGRLERDGDLVETGVADGEPAVAVPDVVELDTLPRGERARQLAQDATGRAVHEPHADARA